MRRISPLAGAHQSPYASLSPATSTGSIPAAIASSSSARSRGRMNVSGPVTQAHRARRVVDEHGVHPAPRPPPGVFPLPLPPHRPKPPEQRLSPPALPAGDSAAVPADIEPRFAASRHWPIWKEEGTRCLSCGACSAVCPTCYCYDVVDSAGLDGGVTRWREWVNCFFRDHALVAGGHNFRPDRAERLRFRCEHKYLGFGEMRGESSCVGCGRCAAACPVDIDLSALLNRLSGVS